MSQKKALNEVNKALQYNPDLEWANSLKGKILLAFNRYDEAMTFFQKAGQREYLKMKSLDKYWRSKITIETGRLSHDDFLTIVKLSSKCDQKT